MAIIQRDFVSPGQYYTADYLRQQELDGSVSFQTMFSLISAADKAAQGDGVVNAGSDDVSPVYRVQSKNPKQFYRNATYDDSQTATEFVSADEVPDGTQMIVTYAAIRTAANSGIAYFHNSDKSVEFGMLYISSKTDFAAGQIYVPVGKNEGLYFTSTQGAVDIFVAVNVYFERV